MLPLASLLRSLVRAFAPTGGEGAAEADSHGETGSAFNAAQREYEPQLFTEIRDRWVRRHMATRAADYTTHIPVSACVLTWNLAAKKPPAPLELAALIGPLADGCELLVVGLQESVELSAQNVTAGAGGPLAGGAIAWEAAITRAVRVDAMGGTDVTDAAGGGGGFVQIVCRQMMGIVLLVYVRERLRAACSAPQTCCVGTGLLGLMGNKGAVAASFRLHNSSICLVCAHLASGASAIDARNLEYSQLLQRVAFSGGGGSAGTSGEAADGEGGDESGHFGEGGEGGGVLDHDFVLWFGDLNYRINLDNDSTRQLATRCLRKPATKAAAAVAAEATAAEAEVLAEVAKAEAAEALETLRAHDQLLDAQRSGTAFGLADGFREAPLSFAPTYKYDIGSDTFDSSEKRRPPAWCDRVLWRTTGGASAGSSGVERLTCSSYARHDERTSDHRPVSAALSLLVARTDEAEKTKVYSQISRSLDAWENSCVPTAQLDLNEANFGPLTYGKPATSYVTITNSGQTALKFSFEPLPTPDDPSLPQPLASKAGPAWLELTPSANLLMPGEACRVRLTALVARPHAASLTETALKALTGTASETDSTGGRSWRMEAILLLRLLNGRDYYVTATAEWRPSCLGLRLTSRTTAGAPLLAPRPAAQSEAAGGEADLMPHELAAMLGVLQAEINVANSAAARAVEAADAAAHAAEAAQEAAEAAEAAAKAAKAAEEAAKEAQEAAKAAEVAAEAPRAAEVADVSEPEAEAVKTAEASEEPRMEVAAADTAAPRAAAAAASSASAAASAAAAAAAAANDAAEILVGALPEDTFAGGSSALDGGASRLSVSSTHSERSEGAGARAERRLDLAAEAASLLAALELGSTPLPTTSLPAVGYALLRWVASLSDPVVPTHLTEAAEAAASSRPDSFAVAKRLPPEHTAVFVPVLVCIRRIVQAHAAATAAASAASKAASDATAASAAVVAAAGGGGGDGTGPVDAAWSAAVRPLPAEYLPSDLRPESAPAASGPLTSAQLSSRLCALVGEAFIARAGWWPAVFIRHFIDERDLEKLHPVDLEKLLEKVQLGRAASP